MKKRKPKPKEPLKRTAAAKPGAQGQPEYRVMTVALIRDPAHLDVVEVAFSESARFYRLLRSNPKFENILTELRKAKEQRRPVHVLLESPQGNTLGNVAAAPQQANTP